MADTSGRENDLNRALTDKESDLLRLSTVLYYLHEICRSLDLDRSSAKSSTREPS